DFHVKAGAPTGTTTINLAANNSAGATTTDVFDSSNTQYTLSPAPTNGGADANIDGSVSILNSANAPAIGSWSAVSVQNQSPSTGDNPGGIGTMLLLSDGTVVADGGNDGTSQDWFQLTPNGDNYAGGTWSTLASMSTQRLFFGSTLLKDGRLMVL